MYVDLWIVALFSCLFGFCAVFNYTIGRRKGILDTLLLLESEKVIMVVNDEVVPYKEKTFQ